MNELDKMIAKNIGVDEEDYNPDVTKILLIIGQGMSHSQGLYSEAKELSEIAQEDGASLLAETGDV